MLSSRGDRDAVEVSVIIPAFNAESTIGLQIEALADQMDPPPFEVIVVDNLSTDKTVLVAKKAAVEAGLGLRTVRAFEFQGPGYARNVGASAAIGRYLMFCDADDAVSRTWVRNGSDAFEHCDLWTGVSLGVRDSDAWATLTDVRARFDDARGSSLPCEDQDGPFPILMGGNFGIDRELFFHLGGFDVAMGSAGEDNEFAARVKSSGIPLFDSDAALSGYRIRTDVSSVMRAAFNAGLAHALLNSRYSTWHLSHHPHWAVGVPRALLNLIRMVLIPRRREWAAASMRIGAAFGVARGSIEFGLLGRHPSPQLGEGLRRDDKRRLQWRP